MCILCAPLPMGLVRPIVSRSSTTSCTSLQVMEFLGYQKGYFKQALNLNHMGHSVQVGSKYIYYLCFDNWGNNVLFNLFICFF